MWPQSRRHRETRPGEPAPRQGRTTAVTELPRRPARTQRQWPHDDAAGRRPRTGRRTARHGRRHGAPVRHLPRPALHPRRPRPGRRRGERPTRLARGGGTAAARQRHRSPARTSAATTDSRATPCCSSGRRLHRAHRHPGPPPLDPLRSPCGDAGGSAGHGRL